MSDERARIEAEQCKWTKGYDFWESSCGEAWEFTTGGPAENKVRFCHGCGRPVCVVEVVEPDGDWT